MKNSIYNKREVPSVHFGCSMAETGASDYDDFDNPLAPLNVIPEGKDILFVENRTEYTGIDGKYEDVKRELPAGLENPSSVREEPLVTVVVSSGVHPITLVNPEVINHAWIFYRKDVVEEIRKFPYKYQQDSIAYGEFFRLENCDSFSLQKVEYFEGWRVLRECEINGIVYQRPEVPEYIIELVMEK